ncbi:MAG: homoserine kinase [Halobacteria archaeon]
MIEVRAPATSANLGSGFDVFGIALDKPADIIRVEKASSTSIEVRGTGSQYIPNDPRKNTAGKVAEELEAPASITIDKGVRPSSGLGSSAASAAGVAVALNELYGLGLSKNTLVEAAAQGEKLVSGDAHDDNVAPCIHGGFTVSGLNKPTVSFDTDFHCVIALPDLIISTEDARNALPEKVKMEERSETVADASRVVAGVLKNDIELMASGMVDEVVERVRAPLIEGFAQARKHAEDAGAEAVTISGAGPSILCICRKERKSRVAEAAIEGFWKSDVKAKAYQARVGDGVQITNRR